MRHAGIALVISIVFALPARADVAGSWTLLGPDGATRGSLDLAVSGDGTFTCSRMLDGTVLSGSARRAADVLHVTLHADPGVVGALDERRVPSVRFDLAIAKGPRWGDEVLQDPSGALRFEPVWREEPLEKLSPDAESYAASRTGDVCVAVRDPRRHVVFTRNGGLAIRTASIVKMIVLAGIMDRANAEGRGLTSFESSNAKPMIQRSDNDATTNLFRSLGGAPGLESIIKKVGMSGTTPNAAWGYTETTAPDMALLAARIYEKTLLGDAMSDQALALLESVIPEQSWGVKSGVPADAEVALKNGWYPEDESGVWRVNAVGAVRDTQSADVGYSICVLTRYSENLGLSYGQTTIIELSKRVFAAESKLGEVVPPADPPPPALPAPTIDAPAPSAPAAPPHRTWWQKIGDALARLVRAL